MGVMGLIRPRLSEISYRNFGTYLREIQRFKLNYFNGSVCECVTDLTIISNGDRFRETTCNSGMLSMF